MTTATARIRRAKRSPDGRLREWSYTREIADKVVYELRKKGIDTERIVKEDTDVPLSERCRRANAIYNDTGKKAYSHIYPL